MPDEEPAVRDAVEAGRRLSDLGLVTGAAGNLSLRSGGDLWVTRSGARLGDLDRDSFVRDVEDASRDLEIHRRIHEEPDFDVAVHCHGTFNVVLGMERDVVEPVDVEGREVLGSVAVLGDGGPRAVGDAVSWGGVALVRGHGIYAAADSFDAAVDAAAYLERSCEVLYRLELLRS